MGLEQIRKLKNTLTVLTDALKQLNCQQNIRFSHCHYPAGCGSAYTYIMLVPSQDITIGEAKISHLRLRSKCLQKLQLVSAMHKFWFGKMELSLLATSLKHFVNIVESRILKTSPYHSQSNSEANRFIDTFTRALSKINALKILQLLILC